MADINDLKIDLDTSDLVLENYDLALVDGNERVRQQMHIHLLTFQGEWYLNTNFGVPYFENVLGKQIDRALIESVIKAEIMKVADVLEITSFEMEIDASVRSLTVEFSVMTTFGVLDTTELLSVSPLTIPATTFNPSED